MTARVDLLTVTSDRSDGPGWVLSAWENNGWRCATLTVVRGTAWRLQACWRRQPGYNLCRDIAGVLNDHDDRVSITAMTDQLHDRTGW
jgi:hypothetical protein